MERNEMNLVDIQNKRNEYYELVNKANEINNELKGIYKSELKKLSGLWNPNLDEIDEFPYSFINKYDNEINIAVVGVFTPNDELKFICYTDEDEVIVLDQYMLGFNFDDIGNIYEYLISLNEHEFVKCYEESLILSFLSSYSDYRSTDYIEINYNGGRYLLPRGIEISESSLNTYIKTRYGKK